MEEEEATFHMYILFGSCILYLVHGGEVFFLGGPG